MEPIKVTIKKLDGTIHGSWDFETEELANEFISKQGKKKRPFGFVKEGEYLAPPEGAVDVVEGVKSIVLVPAVEGQFKEDEYGNKTPIPDVPAVTEEKVIYIVPKQYTIEIEDLTAQVEEENETANMIAIGRNDNSCCEEVLALIGGMNRKKSLTREQITQMMTTYSDANFMLNNRRPDTAKSIIEETPTDAVILTEIDKSRILNIFSKYGI